jgi:hypothetical protein
MRRFPIMPFLVAVIAAAGSIYVTFDLIPALEFYTSGRATQLNIATISRAIGQCTNNHDPAGCYLKLLVRVSGFPHFGGRLFIILSTVVVAVIRYRLPHFTNASLRLLVLKKKQHRP